MRVIEPSATTRSLYSTANRPASDCTCTTRRSGSSATAEPSSRSACGHIARSGTVTCRGSMLPAAASGSSGVYSMKFVGLTIVAPRRPSRRAT